ncbi:MAG: hypothetical protein HRU26_00915 [Psychroserpens sp.]|nr:hypothetical protein [Psychroserpens sp.]
MKLKPTMFYDPEPHQDQFLDSSDMDHPEYNMEAFNEELSKWKARQVKPEEPKSAYADNSRLTWINREALQIGKPEELEAWDNYFKELDLYEENRLRYEGFEKKGDECYNKGLDLSVHFYRNNTGDYGISLFIPEPNGFNVQIDSGISVSLFEQICSENGIELKKI